MSLLDKLMEKRGIKRYEDLSADEKAVYDRQKLVLTGKTVTLKNLEDFCRSQISLIEDKFAAAETANDVYLKACLHVYLNLLKAIDAPKIERESMERYLISLINEA